MIVPDSASKPPQKLNGSSRMTASPVACPARRARPSSVVPETIVPPDPALDSRSHALAGAAEDDLHADVAGCVVRPLRRVRHDRSGPGAKDGSYVRARVDDDLDARIFEPRCRVSVLGLCKDTASRGHVEVDFGMNPFP